MLLAEFEASEVSRDLIKCEVLQGAGELPNYYYFLFCVLLLVFSVSLSVLGS
jgi:hypothetical protein